MAYGLSVSNEFNSVTVDDDYKCFHVQSTGVITNVGSLPATSGNDLLFVRPTVYGALLYASTKTGSAIKASTGNVEWVLLRADFAPIASNGYGLVVYSSTGTVTFDSEKSTMEPAYTYRTSLTGLYSATISLPAKKLATKKRFINASSINIVGLVLNQDNPNIGSFVKRQVRWTSDTTMIVGQDIYPEDGDGPPGDAGWEGTSYYSFADI